jgi:predicted Zn-dependent peptidase
MFDQLPDNMKVTQFENGVRVVTSKMPVQSAALGVWIKVNGQAGDKSQAGYLHFLENILFKGWGQALAGEFEAMGGQVNARTGRELFVLHGLVPGDDCAKLLALFVGMLLWPCFDEHDVERERRVILREMEYILQSGQSIEECVMEQIWPESPIGWPILGYPENIQNVSADMMQTYLQNILQGGQICVVATGDVEHEAIVNGCYALAGLPDGKSHMPKEAEFVPGAYDKMPGGNQTQLMWLLPLPAYGEQPTADYVMADNILAGSMVSRLYQHLRQRSGTVYDIQSRLELFSSMGNWIIKIQCHRKNVRECLNTVEQKVADLIENGPTGQELIVALDKVRAGLIIEDSDVKTRMERLGQDMLYLNRLRTLEERLQQVSRVSVVNIQHAVNTAWSQKAVVRWDY